MMKAAIKPTMRNIQFCPSKPRKEKGSTRNCTAPVLFLGRISASAAKIYYFCILWFGFAAGYEARRRSVGVAQLPELRATQQGVCSGASSHAHLAAKKPRTMPGL